MKIYGLQKTTLLDFPGNVACTVFTGGCNFRCPFCHNASLVLHPTQNEIISDAEFFSFLQKRIGILDGVCITGGEPLLNHDIEDFMRRIRSLGFAVKLDTNGAYPDVLAHILQEGLVDYVAMDIKNAFDKYDITCGTHVNTNDIARSISLLIHSNVAYEFRTTVVRELHTDEDLLKIAESIRGAQQYFLQSFKDSGDIIGEGYSAWDEEKLHKSLADIQKILPSAQLRGI